MMLKKPIILRRPPPNLWFLSGTAVTITSLFILPILIVFSHFLLFEVLLQGGTNIGYNPISNTYINISTHEPIPNTIFYTLYFVNIFQYVGFILILCIFPPYPAPFSMIAYIKASGYKKAVREYELVKKALDIAVPLLIAFTVLNVIHDFDYSNTKDLKTSPTTRELEGTAPTFQQQIHQASAIMHPHIGTFKYVNTLLVLIVMAGILKVVFAVARKEFRLYFARGCFRIIQEKDDEVEKMRYFVKGLNSYNLYLR